MLADYPADENACTARYYRGTIFKALKRYREAAAELLLVPEQGAGCAVEGKALLEAGECLIAAGDPREAAGVLRPIWQGGRFPDQAPRAGYSLAVALADAGRDLEADAVLEEVVTKHPMSPVSALALIRLGGYIRTQTLTSIQRVRHRLHTGCFDGIHLRNQIEDSADRISFAQDTLAGWLGRLR